MPTRKSLQKMEKKIKNLIEVYVQNLRDLDNPKALHDHRDFLEYLAHENPAHELLGYMEYLKAIPDEDAEFEAEIEALKERGPAYNLGWELFIALEKSFIVGHIYEPGMGDLFEWGYAESDEDGVSIYEESEVIKAIPPATEEA